MKDDGPAAGEARSGGLTTGVGKPPEFERARGSGGDKIGETGEGTKVTAAPPSAHLQDAG